MYVATRTTAGSNDNKYKDDSVNENSIDDSHTTDNQPQHQSTRKSINRNHRSTKKKNWLPMHVVNARVLVTVTIFV